MTDTDSAAAASFTVKAMRGTAVRTTLSLSLDGIAMPQEFCTPANLTIGLKKVSFSDQLPLRLLRGARP